MNQLICIRGPFLAHILVGMSQDLLSFLDEPQSQDRPQPSPNPPQDWPIGVDTWSSTSHVQPNSNTVSASQQDSPATDTALHEVDDDDFGDFEDASAAPVRQDVPIPASSVPHPRPRSPVSQPRINEVRSPFPARANKTSRSAPQPPPEKKDAVGSHPFAGRMDLLFGADDTDYDAGADELGDLANNPEAAMAYSKRIIAEQQETAKGKGKGKSVAGQIGGFIDLEEERERAASKGGGQADGGKSSAKDPDILFDADDISDAGDAPDEDDFGDFEDWGGSVATKAANTSNDAQPTSLGMDLLGLDDVPPQPAARSAQERADTSYLQTPQSNGSSRPTAASAAATRLQQDNDFWDNFETTAAASKGPQPTSSQPDPDDSWADFETSAPASPPPKASPARKSPPQQKPTPSPSSNKNNKLPPANIPQPATLLSLFPALFASADDSLFTAMSKLDLKSRSMLLSHPASHQFLRGYLAHIRVLARIIAGRKLRWKRDQRLSQSMRIGPAAAGGKGGMKLAGLDKAEVAKEDREVLDTVRLYRAQVAKLRSAVTAASSAPGLPKLPSAPDIQDPMPVKALKQSEGGITAREACALCGLKREERVVKIDDGVEDSFGEWWVQGMSMHVQCKNFWEEFERRLKSR